MIAEKTLTRISINHKKLNDRIIEMERNMHRLQQYGEYGEIARIPNSITNDLLEEHAILIFEKLNINLYDDNTDTNNKR